MRTVLTAAAFLLVALAYRDARAVCHGTTTPVFTEVVLSAPDGGVVKDTIAYAQGTRLDVTYTLPACTAVSNVYADGNAVVFTRWGEDVVLPDGRRRQTMRVYVANDGRGRAASVRLVASATSDYAVAGPLPTGDLVVTRVGVKRANGRVGVSVPESEVRNRFLMAIYGAFGPEGRARQSGADAYDPAYDLYDEPTVLMYPGATHPYVPPQLAIEDGKLHFAYELDASIPYWCDASVHLSGAFALEVGAPEGTEGRFVHAMWDGGGPDVDISFPIYCDVAHWMSGFIEFVVLPWYTSQIEDRVERIVQQAIDGAAGTCPIDPATGLRRCTGIDPLLTSPTVTLAKDQIVVELSVPESVTIDVPYRAGGVDDPAATGLALSPGAQVIVMARGLATTCENDWSGHAIGTCSAVRSGPQGMYNMIGNGPLTYPYLGVASLTDDEDEAFGGLAQLYRDPNQLPLPYENAGAVVTRVAAGGAASRPMPVALPCTVSAGATAPARVAFGVNDHRTTSGGELGTGSFEVHVVWPIAGQSMPHSCAYEVVGGIAAKYAALGGAAGFLGLPLTDEIDTISDTGRMSHFQGGSVLWKRGAGEAFSVIGGIRMRYADLAWERGPLGYPITDEMCSAEGACRARLSRFERGTLVWTATSGVRAVLGAIDAKWVELGATVSALGLPTSEQLPVEKYGVEVGLRQEFEHGAIAWRSSTGAHEVRHGIFAKWVAMGRETGALGFPTTDEDCSRSPGCFNHFEGGSIYWHPDHHTRAIRGPIRSYWLSLGGVDSWLGWPTSDLIYVPKGAGFYPAYRFQHGTIADYGPWYGGITILP